MSLESRAAALGAEARTVLTRLTELGDLMPTGSVVSGLMVWKDLDVMLLGGPEFSPHDVLRLLDRAVDLPGVTGFDYVDERDGSRDARYHVVIRLDDWRIDLSIWLYDDHAGVTRFHQELAERISPEERAAVLAIKDVWHRRPEYPAEVSGFEVYTAVLEHGVRTADEFGRWLSSR
jgi:hypothetical protein